MIDFFRKFFGQRILNLYHLATAVVANFVYGFPSRRLRVIGVTGTDGKTTTTNMIASIFRAAEFPVSFLSTINAQIGETPLDTGLHTTTPSPFLLQKLLRQMVRAGSTYAVLEVTSHALDQYRVWGIRFESAVLTNVTHEHLDYHKTYEAYLRAKIRLFHNAAHSAPGGMVMNHEDESFFQLAKEDFRGKQVLNYGLSRPAQFWASNIRETLRDTSFFTQTPDSQFEVHLNLPGQFNVLNALAAIALASIYRIPAQTIVRGLETLSQISGRLEFFPAPAGFTVLVDFAHTPNGLRQLLAFLRPKVSGRIILVFGSAGHRDRTKRPLMGEFADQFADVIVLTREDNRSESVETICQEIAQGIRQKQMNRTLFVITDRRTAIRFALKQARRGDLVVITGKGHEQSLNIDGREFPWDDRRVVREELKELQA